jgi:hypothetical protein
MNNNASNLIEFRGEINQQIFLFFFQTMAVDVSRTQKQVQLDRNLMDSFFAMSGLQPFSVLSSRQKGFFVKGTFSFLTKTERFKFAFAWETLKENNVELEE